MAEYRQIPRLGVAVNVSRRARIFLWCLAVIGVALGIPGRAQDGKKHSHLLENLAKLGRSSLVDDTSVDAGVTPDGPKGISAADLDGDKLPDLVTGNSDGTITILYGGVGGGFEPAMHLLVNGSQGLRDLITANISGDERHEIVAADPFAGKVFIYSFNSGSRAAVQKAFSTWTGARAVTAGDFDGDGVKELVVGGAGAGLCEYKRDASGDFKLVMNLSEGMDVPAAKKGSAKPVFSLNVWHDPWSTRDRLFVSYAGSKYVFEFECPERGGVLDYKGKHHLNGEEVYDLATGYFSRESRSTGKPDLVTAVPLSGSISIRSYNGSYPKIPQQAIAVPGEPRGFATTDANRDGWPDLIVASRETNSVSLYLNREGVMKLSSQSPAGTSPRDVVVGEFGGVGSIVAAVMNRESRDVSLHRIDPTSGFFLQSAAIEDVVGGARFVSVVDVTGDGCAEVIFLSAATKSAVIREYKDNGWSIIGSYPMGVSPKTLATIDLNGDGRIDLQSVDEGALRYRLGLETAPGGARFGPLIDVATAQNSSTPATVLNVDLDGDGDLDRAALRALDGKIDLYRSGTGLSEPQLIQTVSLGSYCIQIAALDVDGNGTRDIVGFTSSGGIAVAPNSGQWLAAGSFDPKIITTGGADDVSLIAVPDFDGDQILDLLVYTWTGIRRWAGLGAMKYSELPRLSGVPVYAAAAGDCNADGVVDYVSLDGVRTTASIRKGVLNGGTTTLADAERYAIPAVRELAFGDIDGDRLDDLVGAGDYLWVALSAKLAPDPVPIPIPIPVVDIRGVVINEILANTDKYVSPGMTKTADAVELFNGTDHPVELRGWTLMKDPEENQTHPERYILPSRTLAPREYAVIYCDDGGYEWHPNFKLPAAGGTIRLFDPTGQERDAVTYGLQQPDISFARLYDGSQHLVFNPFPSIGTANYDNGNPLPQISFEGIDIGLFRAGRWRFRAKAWSVTGLTSLLVVWRQLGNAANSGEVPLFDDGEHGDGAAGDGLFGGDWESPVGVGIGIEFYIKALDREKRVVSVPHPPEFKLPNEPTESYTLAAPTLRSRWELSEVVTDSDFGLPTGSEAPELAGAETPEKADWLELRCVENGGAWDDAIFVSDSFAGFEADRIGTAIPAGTSAIRGASRIVLLDGKTSPGHAPFNVSSEGETLYLFRKLPSGGSVLLDAVSVPRLRGNESYARLGENGPFVVTTPTPGASNAPKGGGLFQITGEGGSRSLIFAFPGTGSVEASTDLRTWQTVQPWLPATGFENTYTEPMKPELGPRRFFRVR